MQISGGVAISLGGYGFFFFYLYLSCLKTWEHFHRRCHTFLSCLSFSSRETLAPVSLNL